MTRIQSITDIKRCISEDRWMMDALRIVGRLELPDWYIGAGFIRNKVWDVLHGYAERTPLNDIDVIYFDPSDISVEREQAIERKLHGVDPEKPWSVKNQARMHIRNGERPYINSVDAFSRWPETATCIGVTIVDGEVMVAAPHGIDDLVDLIVRPSPSFERKMDIYRARIQSKHWADTWPKVQFIVD